MTAIKPSLIVKIWIISGILVFQDLFGALDPFVYQNAKGSAVYNEICSSCHSYCPPEAKAPPVCIISDRYNRFFNTKESGLDFMQTFIKDPKSENARMYGAVSKFGEMTPQPLKEIELKAVSQWFWRAGQNSSLPPNLKVGIDSLSPSSFRFTLPSDSEAELYLLDSEGKELSFLKNSAGSKTIVFEGKDPLGKILPEGFYEFLVLQDGMDTLGQLYFKGNSNSVGIEALLKRGELVFKQSCQICHTYNTPPKTTAPAMVEISQAYRGTFSSLEAAQSHIVEYTIKPEKEKSKLSEAILAKYPLMSPVKRSASDLNAVAAYVWMAADPASIPFGRSAFQPAGSITVNRLGTSAVEFIFNREATPVLTIFSAKGDKILKLSQADGSGRMVWDGKVRSGRQMARGIYFYNLQFPSDNQTLNGAITLFR